ncbi:hypothetical protein ABEV04_11600 [Heyndrickxia faecalis]|uniref:hypothetical protein n=1 Tax=Heyndrickxia TaxID=2837504 RepID=UPI002E1D7A22|nr:O-antigen ligase family protein [Weizmannia sp. CD-2023]
MVQLRINYLNNYIIFIYLLIIFFILPVQYNPIVDSLFFMISAISFIITFLLKIQTKQEIKLKIVDIILYFFIGIIYIFVLLFSPYPKSNITVNFIYMIFIIYYFYRNNLITPNGLSQRFYKFAYLFMFASLLIQFYLSLRQTKTLYFVIGWDKNYTGVILFFFFSFCYKRKFIIGLAFAVFISIFLGSRGYILMLLLFFIIIIFKKSFYRLVEKVPFKRMWRVLLLLLMTITLFSFFWVNVISSKNVVDYQQGLNDTSNKMRFVANIKAIDLLSTDRYLSLFGYDNDLKKVLGIDSSNLGEHSRYYGVRLVQPHNSILNTVVKTGILFSVLYFLIISRTIDKYYLKENLQYIFPYIACSMIMHSLLNTSFLLFFLLILHTPTNKSPFVIRCLKKQGSFANKM